jgi:hypothetical protein
MKHKLHRAEPKTMAEFMAIAEKYASANSVARVQYTESVLAAGQSQSASGQDRHHNRDRHGKRKDEHHDNKYASKQVAAIQGSPGSMGGSQKRKGDKFNKDKYTIEVMLDQPCMFHSVSGKPVGHTTRQCSFTRDLERGSHQLPGSPPGLPAEGKGIRTSSRPKELETTLKRPTLSSTMSSLLIRKMQRTSSGLALR